MIQQLWFYTHTPFVYDLLNKDPIFKFIYLSLSFVQSSVTHTYNCLQDQHIYRVPATNSDIWRELTHDKVIAAVHQLPYYKPQQVLSTAWIVLVTWYTCHKLVGTKILQNFWLSLGIIQVQIFNLHNIYVYQ